MNKTKLTLRLHDLTDTINSLGRLGDDDQYKATITKLKSERREIIEKLRNNFGKVSAMDEQLYVRIEKENFF